MSIEARSRPRIAEVFEPKRRTGRGLPLELKIIEAVRLDKTHRCPLHDNPEECERALIKPEGARIKPEDEVIYSTLIDPIVTFEEIPERLREKTSDQSKILPPTLFRTFYEGSATLSSRVPKDNHVRHRENEELKLRSGNAFQTVGEIDLKKSLTKEGIQRHLVWNKKQDPSTWISMFNQLSHAQRRAEFHYNESMRIGQRVTIAEISTVDLIAATVHADSKTTWEITTKDKRSRTHRLYYSITKRRVAIPVWVSRSVRPEDGSSITAEQLMDSQPDLLVSIEELRNINLVEGPNSHSRRRTIQADGHSYEWLALGRIREDRIMKVIPFDGKEFHMVPPLHTVRSKAATDDWIFDFEHETWRLESEMRRRNARKRKNIEAGDDDVVEVGSMNVPKRKKGNNHALNFSAIETIYHI